LFQPSRSHIYIYIYIYIGIFIYIRESFLSFYHELSILRQCKRRIFDPKYIILHLTPRLVPDWSRMTCLVAAREPGSEDRKRFCDIMIGMPLFVRPDSLFLFREPLKLPGPAQLLKALLRMRPARGRHWCARAPFIDSRASEAPQK